jgi:hypothetical protein
MANYRLYSLSPEGHIQRVEDFEAEDDSEAITEAGRRGYAPKELWCENRRIQQWPRAEAAAHSA